MTRSRMPVVTGPLARYSLELEQRLAALGYARSTRTEVQAAAAVLSGWLREVGASAAKLTDELFGRFVQDCVAQRIICPASGVDRLIVMLRADGVLSVDAAPLLTKRDLLLDGFVEFLREERGLSSLSVQAYRADVMRFLQSCGRDDLRGMTSAEISQADLSASALPVSGRRRSLLPRGSASTMRPGCWVPAIAAATPVDATTRRCC